MRIVDRGLLNRGEPGTPRAVSTFPAVTALNEDQLLASYRVGTTKDSADESIEFRYSDDGGHSWSSPDFPFDTEPQRKRGSLKLAYVTPLGGERLLCAAMWVDRETYPGKPLFNEETQGCLPMAILLADSDDRGRTWTPWRKMPLPDEIGPPSLTSPLLRLASGRLAASIETNKQYDDASRWLQRVVYVYSDDEGQTWSSPVTVSQDPSARIYSWDQRAGVLTDGRLVTFSWTYDCKTTRYLNVHRRLSDDEGNTWTIPEDLGFADQPSRPAILPDGRVVVAWVDRFQSQSIRARLAERCDAPFLPETEVVLFECAAPVPNSAAEDKNTGDLLVEMGDWSYGLPFAETLPNGEVMVVHYEGTSASMETRWTRLAL